MLNMRSFGLIVLVAAVLLAAVVEGKGGRGGGGRSGGRSGGRWNKYSGEYKYKYKYKYKYSGRWNKFQDWGKYANSGLFCHHPLPPSFTMDQLCKLQLVKSNCQILSWIGFYERRRRLPANDFFFYLIYTQASSTVYLVTFKIKIVINILQIKDDTREFCMF